MPLIDTFPPQFPSSPANYYPLRSYSYHSDAPADPKYLSFLGIGDNTLKRTKYYSGALDTSSGTGGVVDLDITFPLDPSLGGTFVNLLREDDKFVGSLAKNTFLLSSLGISLATLTAASGANTSNANITTHSPTTATFASLLAKDSDFCISLTNYLVTGVITGGASKSPSIIQNAIVNNSVLNQLLTALFLTPAYKIRSATGSATLYSPNASFKTNFSKQFGTYLNLTDNDAVTSQTLNIASLNDSVNFIRDVVFNAGQPLPYTGTNSYTVFEGVTGNRYAPVVYATRIPYGGLGTSTDPASALLHPDNFGIANLFYNKKSLIQNLTSIDIDTITALISSLSVNNAYVTSLSASILSSVSAVIDNASISTLSTTSLTFSTLKDANGVTIDYLPLTGGVMTGDIKFGDVNGPRLAQGRYDSSRGGLSGISLVCSLDYDFNWQAGWLTSLEQDRITPRPLYIDSGIGTSLRVWDSVTDNGTEITHLGIKCANLTATNLSSANISSNDIKSNSISATSVASVSLSSQTLSTTTLSFTTLQKINNDGSTTNITNSVGGGSVTDPLILTGVSCLNLSATNSLITNLTAINLSSAKISSSELIVSSLKVIKNDGSVVDVTNNVSTPGSGGSVTDPLILTGISCINLSASNSLINNLTGSTLTIGDSSIFFVDIINGAYAQTLTAINMYVTANLSGKDLEFETATINNLLKSASISSTNLTADNIFGSILISSTSSLASNISGTNLYISNLAILPGISASTNSVLISKPISSTQSIHTTQDISAANIYGNIMGTVVNVGESNQLEYLSAKRADINELTSFVINVADRTITQTVPVLDIDNNPVLDGNGDPVTTIETETVLGLITAAEGIFTSLTAVNECSVFAITANSITCTDSIIISSADTGVAFYSNTGNKVGINTSTPSVELTVQGSISASNTITANNLSIQDGISAPNISAENLVVTSNISSLSGTIYGNINATQSTAINLFTNLSATALTASSLYTPQLTTATLSCTTISSLNGNSNLWTSAYYIPVTINLILDGGGSSVQGGVRGRIEVPYDIKLLSWAMYADVASLTNFTAVTVLSSNYDSYPAVSPLHLTPADVAVINIGDIKNTANITESEWNIFLNKGDILHFGLSPELAWDGGAAPVSATSITLSLRGLRQ